MSSGIGPEKLLTYGGILFIFSLMYFLIIVLTVLQNTHLGITNFSEIHQYILPVLILDILFCFPFFFLMFHELGVPETEELLQAVVIISIVAAIIGFLFIHLNIHMITEEHPAEYISYEGSEVFRYLDPLHRNGCEYGLLPEEYLEGYDECLSLTSMALAVRYFIYLGPHNPVTLLIGGHVLRKVMGWNP